MYFTVNQVKGHVGAERLMEGREVGLIVHPRSFNRDVEY